MGSEVRRFRPDDGLPLIVDHRQPSKPFVLTESICYSGPALSVTVPKGFRHDGASVPRVLWAILPRVGRYSRAALIHDYLYDTKRCGKQIADAAFYDIMKYDGVNPVVRWVMWKAVEWFGGAAWRKPDPS